MSVNKHNHQHGRMDGGLRGAPPVLTSPLVPEGVTALLCYHHTLWHDWQQASNASQVFKSCGTWQHRSDKHFWSRAALSHVTTSGLVQTELWVGVTSCSTSCWCDSDDWDYAPGLWSEWDRCCWQMSWCTLRRTSRMRCIWIIFISRPIFQKTKHFSVTRLLQLDFSPNSDTWIKASWDVASFSRLHVLKLSVGRDKICLTTMWCCWTSLMSDSFIETTSCISHAHLTIGHAHLNHVNVLHVNVLTWTDGDISGCFDSFWLSASLKPKCHWVCVTDDAFEGQLHFLCCSPANGELSSHQFVPAQFRSKPIICRATGWQTLLIVFHEAIKSCLSTGPHVDFLNLSFRV